MNPIQRDAHTMPAMACVSLLLGLSLSGCSGDDFPPGEQGVAVEQSVETSADSAGTDRQTAFRVRSDFEARLNSDEGWGGEMDQAATVEADRPFRLRLEIVAAPDKAGPRKYRLETRRNGGVWEPLPAENFPQPEKLYEIPLGPRIDGSVDRAWRVESGRASRMSWGSGEEGAHLQIAADGEPLLALGHYTVHWEPVAFAARLRFDREGARAGVVFDFRDADNYSRIDLIVPDTVRLVRVEDGQSSVRSEHAVDVARGRWLELEMSFEDREIVVEFDDEALVFSEPQARGFKPRLGMHVPAGSAVDFDAFVLEGEPRSPRSSIVASPVFEHGAPTTDLLPVSERPFSGGAGVSFAEHTPPWAAHGGHGEWEFPIVIRRFSDRAALNESGDRFDYRLVGDDGEALATDATASVTLAVPEGHVGGTFAETPMRIGPWQADSGDLYFLMEPSETWNRLMTVKSSDGGRSWREVDGRNRPETGDLEGFASILVEDRIHMLHQTTDHVWYHVFNTADHPEAPDTWAVRDERLASPGEPPTQVADITLRSDGSVLAVYGGPDDIRLRTRSPDGRWSEERVIDGEAGAFLSGPTLMRGRGDVVHLAYTSSDGNAWYRRIGPDGALGKPVRFASDLGTDSEDVGSILPLLYLPESDSVSVVYRSGDGRLFERRVNAEGGWSDPLVVSQRRVVQNAVDSDQAGADAVVHAGAVHVLFIEDGTGRLFHASRRDERWRDAELLIEGAAVQWVRGSILDLPGQGRVYGYVYDAGSDGGSGMNRFDHVLLNAP